MRREQAFRLPLFLPVALAAGAAVYMALPVEPGWPVLAAAFLGPVLGRLVLLKLRGGLATFILTLLALAGAGAIAGKLRSELVAAPVLVEQIGPVQVEGVIVELDATERNRRVRVAVRAIEGLAPSRTPAFVRFSYRGELGLGPGRAVSCRAILSPPPRPVVPGDYVFHRDAWFQQLGAVGFSVGECRPLAVAPPTSAIERFGLWIGAVRRALSEHVNTAAGRGGGGMAAAMVSGDRSFITPADAEALRLSGLAHLLSISGVHMVLVGGVVFFGVRMTWPVIEPLALRVPSVHAAAFAALAACTLYFMISGMEVATQRAYVMALIGFGAKLLDKPALSLRSLSVALAIVVMLQPEAVVTPGFQMSFAASASLIALYEIWPKLHGGGGKSILSRLWLWGVGAVATSLVASFATMPFALHHFERAAIFSVFANVVSTPVISLVTTPAAIGAAIAAPLGLDGPFLSLMGTSLDWVISIAHLSVAWSPDPEVTRLPANGMAWAGVAIFAFCILRGNGRWFAIIPASFFIAIWITAPRAAAYVASDGSVFLKAGRSWLELTDWRGRNGLDPLIIGDRIEKGACPGKGAPCMLDLPDGRFEIRTGDPALFVRSPNGSETGSPACPTDQVLVFTPADGSAELTIRPCEIAVQGGAVVEMTRPGRRIRTDRAQSGRYWTQPLLLTKRE